MMNTATNTQASAEVIQAARAALKEIEQEFIMLRFKFGAPRGNHKNEIHNVSHIGILTIHGTRDLMFMNNIRFGIGALENLLREDETYITLKRLKAIRQRFNVMIHKNQNASNTRSHSAWNKKSAGFLAGKVLAGILNEHLPLDVFIPTATPI